MVLLATLGAHPARASAEVAPHVPTGTDTDVCAMCHRSHTSASSATLLTQEETPTLENALLTGTGEYDVEMCYVCHGSDQLGSGIDVQTDFESQSSHVLAPAASAYGPTPKQCSDCHDSHGSARTIAGEPYPALLRSFDASNVAAYGGAAYCATCHTIRPGSTWNGLAVWSQTAHAAGMAGPLSGTTIVCSDCHNPHGSPIAPIIRTQLVPPATPATTTVAANDRTLCLACHAVSSATWPGESVYATSTHASSTTAVTIPGEWPDTGATRPVGECQVCHNPMGQDDGTGNAVPRLVRATGQALCYQCHDSTGPAQTDMARLAYPVAAASAPEVIAVFGASAGMSGYRQILAYTQESTGTAPRALVGPRPYSSVGPISASAWGDIDGNGTNELVIADAASPRLDVFTYDPLRGLSDRVGPGTQPIAGTAEYVGVGDVVLDASALPEIVVVDLPAGNLYVYRWDGSGLTLVQGPVSVGNVSGMAIGDVQRDPAVPDVVLTTNAPDGLYMLSDIGGALALDGPHTTLAGPRAPSLGDIDGGGGNTIVVLNAGEPTSTVSLFKSNGNLVASAAGNGTTGLIPVASAIADILPGVTPAGTSGLEVLVAYADSAGSSRLNVFPQDKKDIFAAPLGYDIGTRANPAAIACGDVDGDGRIEAAIATAGSFTRDTARVAPSLQVWRADAAGTALVAPDVHWAGGAELAGGRAGVAVADLGGVGPTRHPVGAVAATHVSTETALVPRHVECSDCHNSHQANASTTSAPAASGRIAGTWGVAVNNISPSQIQLTEQRGVRYEYELCLKCHSAWSVLDGGTDIASKVNTENASMHAVEATSATVQATDGSFESGWSVSSVMYCTDCHGNSGVGEPVGPHVSRQAPILKRGIWGVEPGDIGSLCYGCHRREVYFTGGLDGVPGSTSLFYDADKPAGQRALHAYHTDALGFGCQSCHDSHGSAVQPHILRSDIAYVHTADGGSCASPCHTGTQQRSYARP